MERSPLTAPETPETPAPDAVCGDHERLLLEVALRAIRTRLLGDETTAVEPEDFPPELRVVRASFVTLHRHGQLRGCIGSLEATSPLVVSVWHNARQAAFHDPRFPPLSERELDSITIHVSILSPLEPMSITSEQNLLDRLRPGVDGLLIEDGACRGTFLPVVWEALPEPRRFVRELKRKAGLAADHWSGSLAVWRYTAHSIPHEEPDAPASGDRLRSRS